MTTATQTETVPETLIVKCESRGLQQAIEELNERAAPHKERMAELAQRIEAGERKRDEAKAAGRPVTEIVKKLGKLIAEAKDLDKRYTVPIYVLQLLQEDFVGLEAKVVEGSKLRILIPGVVDVTMALDGVPF